MRSSNLGNGVIATVASGSHGPTVRSPVMGVLAPSSQGSLVAVGGGLRYLCPSLDDITLTLTLMSAPVQLSGEPIYTSLYPCHRGELGACLLVAAPRPGAIKLPRRGLSREA